MSRAIDFDDCGIAEALSTYWLSVPPNQRSYKWKKENALDLFEDLDNAMSQGGSEYFLGTMVFIEIDKALKKYEVADGQQRLATIAILLAAVRDYLFEDKTQAKFITEIRKHLVSYHFDSDRDLPRLELNLEDRDFFAHRILSDPAESGRLEATTRNRESHELIDDAAKTAKDFVAKITSSSNPSHRIERIKGWLRFVQNSARVIIVKVTTPGKAFTIFETLNDRGIKLSQVDLLKNYLYGIASNANRLPEIQTCWTEMFSGLEAIGREDLSLDYIRQLWISYKGHVTADELYEKIKDFAKSPALAVEFAGMLSQNITSFAAILDPSHVYWESHTEPTRRCIAVLSNNLRIDRIRPLLLSILSRFNKKEAERSFRICVSWAVRFLIVGGIGSGTIEKFYAEVAQNVRDGNIDSAQALAEAMKKYVPNDKDFQAAFETAKSSRSYYARYYLHALDRYLKDKGTTSQRDAALAVDDESERFDLEHVLPKKGGDTTMDDETRGQWLTRLGNLALLEKPQNSGSKSETFLKKKPSYSKSQFLLTQSIAKESSWGMAEIERRQKALAALAPKTWPTTVRQ